MKRLGTVLALVALTVFAAGCNSANQGSVQVETKWGKIVNVHQPGDWFTTWSPGAASYEVDMRPWNEDIQVHTATKDNAALVIHLKVTGQIKGDLVSQYLTTFGFDQKDRETKRNQMETGAVQTVGRDAVVLHDAYSVFAEQDAIQNFMTEKLKVFFADRMYSHLLSVQIIDKPTFDNKEIEEAASKVVAAQKLKQAQEQYKQAAQIELEKNQIINQIYVSSPQAYQLALLEKQKDIASAWAAHQGPLVFGGGGNFQLQVPSK
jgi:hypothetical protein